MKQAKPLAVIEAGQEKPQLSPVAAAFELDLPQTFTPDNLAGTLDILTAAVPDRVGHDQHAQRQDRAVAQGVMRVTEAIYKDAPENPWDRSPLLDEAKRLV